MAEIFTFRDPVREPVEREDSRNDTIPPAATKLKRILSPRSIPRPGIAGPATRTRTLTDTRIDGGARTTTTVALLHTDGMHRVSFYFLKIPMDRMPPASTERAPFAHVRIGGGTHTHTGERERGRTYDHTNPHPRVRLVKRVWVARTRRREGDRESSLASGGQRGGKLPRGRGERTSGKSKKKRAKKTKKKSRRRKKEG